MMPPYFYRSPYGFHSFNRFHSLHNKYIREHKTVESEAFHEDVKSKKNDLSDVRNVQDCRSAVFEIFGIKLFFDDLLILSLIFFLYNEGVKDEFLFISLILLLLS